MIIFSLKSCTCILLKTCLGVTFYNFYYYGLVVLILTLLKCYFVKIYFFEIVNMSFLLKHMIEENGDFVRKIQNVVINCVTLSNFRLVYIVVLIAQICFLC